MQGRAQFKFRPSLPKLGFQIASQKSVEYVVGQERRVGKPR